MKILKYYVTYLKLIYYKSTIPQKKITLFCLFGKTVKFLKIKSAIYANMLKKDKISVYQWGEGMGEGQDGGGGLRGTSYYIQNR